MYQIGEKFNENDNQRFTTQDVLTKIMKKLQSPHKSMIPEVLILLKLILVSPATNTISESFSALKRLRTLSLWSTMPDLD